MKIIDTFISIKISKPGSHRPSSILNESGNASLSIGLLVAGASIVGMNSQFIEISQNTVRAKKVISESFSKNSNSTGFGLTKALLTPNHQGEYAISPPAFSGDKFALVKPKNKVSGWKFSGNIITMKTESTGDKQYDTKASQVAGFKGPMKYHSSKNQQVATGISLKSIPFSSGYGTQYVEATAATKLTSAKGKTTNYKEKAIISVTQPTIECKPAQKSFKGGTEINLSLSCNNVIIQAKFIDKKTGKIYKDTGIGKTAANKYQKNQVKILDYTFKDPKTYHIGIQYKNPAGVLIDHPKTEIVYVKSPPPPPKPKPKNNNNSKPVASGKSPWKCSDKCHNSFKNRSNGKPYLHKKVRKGDIPGRTWPPKGGHAPSYGWKSYEENGFIKQSFMDPQYPSRLVCQYKKGGWRLVAFDPRNSCKKQDIGPRGGSGCFSSDTLIRTSWGQDISISQLRAGDHVWNPITEKSQTIKRVIRGPEKHPLLEITVGEYQVNVTKNHPFLTDRGLLTARELRLGDKIPLSGSSQKWEKILSLKPVNPVDHIVWNIELEGGASASDHFLLADGVVTGDLYLQKSLTKKSHLVRQSPNLKTDITP